MNPWGRRVRFAVLVALADLALFNLYQIIHSPNPWPDFAFFYAFAKAGLSNGYQHVYEPAVQQGAIQSLFPGAPYYPVVNPPPFGWLLTPLTFLPYPLALWIWTVAMIASLALAALLLSPPGVYWRVLYTGLWLAFLPAYLVFVSAPLAPLLVLSLALTWKLIREERQVAAGLVLAVAVLKPTVLILVPFALLAAGYTRVFVAWLAAAAALVIASLVSLGPSGLSAYVSISSEFASRPYFLRWSLAPIFGEGGWVVAVVFIAVMTPWLARRVRAQGPEAVIAVGVMGSFLINHHMTPGDLMVLLVPVWLLLRERQSRRSDALLGVAWTGAWLSLIFPIAGIAVAAVTPVVLFARSVFRRSAPTGAPEMALSGR